MRVLKYISGIFKKKQVRWDEYFATEEKRKRKDKFTKYMNNWRNPYIIPPPPKKIL